ncbi:MAG: type II secretion system minor pseudopilin GspI [Algicola sp.]|nr:type II secretion system minor pseudopilin GspI [Algicola sp.]
MKQNLNHYRHCAKSRSCAKHRKNRGFTLLETLVAIAILAVAGVAIVKSTSEHLSSLIILKEITFSSWVAENRLVELQLEGKWPPKNNKKGKMEMAGREWFWRQEVEKVGDKNMRQITIFVLLKEDDKEPAYQLTTFLGDPK